MNKNKVTAGFIFFCLSQIVWFPPALFAQNDPGTGGYDYDGRAIVAILPFIGEEEPAEIFNQATAGAVSNLQKYSPRNVSLRTVEAAGVRVPTDMPPVRELVPGVRFALTGGVYPGDFPGEYYLQLWLWDMSNASMIYTDDLVYEDINEGLQSLPGLVEWLFSHITVVSAESDLPVKGWEEKLITAGVRSGISQRWYTEPEKIAPGAQALNFEGGLFVSVFLNSLLSFQAEMNFTFDNLVYRGIDRTGGEGESGPVYVYANEKYTAYSLTFPLLAKVNFRPGNFRLAPFAGIYAFVPLGEALYRRNPGGTDSFSWSAAAPLGYIAGLETAMKLGPGLLIGDIRYSGDFGAITIDKGNGEDTAYRRGGISFTLGYAFGFIDIRKR
jgi:hypothetical protein